MSALNSSVVSTATTVGAKLFQWGLVLGEKKNTSGHHYTSGACNIVSCVIFCSLRGGQILVYINRHNPTRGCVCADVIKTMLCDAVVAAETEKNQFVHVFVSAFGFGVYVKH